MENCEELMKKLPYYKKAVSPRGSPAKENEMDEQIRNLILVQRILEEEKHPGAPEAQIALEVIHSFNIAMI